MTIKNEAFEELHLIRTTCTGVLSRMDFKLSRRFWSASIYFGFSELFDITDCDISQLSHMDLVEHARLAYAMDDHVNTSKIAVLHRAEQDLMLTELYTSARFLSGDEDKREVQTFTHFDDAQNWLGITLPEV